MNTLEAPAIRLFYETHGCGLSDVGAIGSNAGLACPLTPGERVEGLPPRIEESGAVRRLP
jgi:hypothetical protein